jgi:dipeptidyl aminopeptidase/acylaminoacyl peptidase
VTPRRGAVPLPPDAAALRLETWRVPSAVGTIAVWFIPPRGGATIVVSHGTQADRSSILYEVRALAAAGHGVAVLDYPGHGESGGQVEIGPGRVTALRAVVDSVAHRRDVDPTRLGLYGFSFGANTSILLAADDPRIRAIAAAGPPLDYPAHVAYSYANHGFLIGTGANLVYRLRGDDVASLNLTAAAQKIAPRPILIVNGERDLDVPPSDGARIAALVGPSATRWLIRGAPHVGLQDVEPMYGARLARFFSENLPARALVADTSTPPHVNPPK